MNCVFGYKRLQGAGPRPEPRFWPALKSRGSEEMEHSSEVTEELSLSFSASSSESLSANSVESGEHSHSPSKNSLFPWKLRHGPRKKRKLIRMGHEGCQLTPCLGFHALLTHACST